MAARIATAVLALVACSRTSAPDPTAVVASAPRRDPAAASAPAAPDPAPAPVAAREPASARALAEPGSASAARTPAPSGEARRSTIPRLEADAQLLPHLATLRDHFGATARGPFEVQHVDLADGRAAVLVSRADESDPIVLAYDRDVLLWSKLRPTAGIVAPVKHVTLLPGPEGGAAVFAWVASLHMVAARTWADDGNPFGDFELFAPDGCDALSAAYGPGQGWVVACTSPQGTRAQRLREDCSIAWGKDGVAVGSMSASGPATIAFDSVSSILLFERVAAVGGERLLAFRYDPDGQSLWPTPADLGADAGHAAAPRVGARVVSDGLVRVDRPSGIVGKGTARASEVNAAGEVRYR
jgi:hypothetical protein